MATHLANGTLDLPVRRRRTWVSRRRSGRATIPPVRGLIPIAVLLLVWQALGSSDSFTFPTPWAWIQQIPHVNDDVPIFPAILETLKTFVLGLAMGTVFGILLGMLTGSSRTVDQALAPVFDFFRALPPPAVISVILLSVGISYRSVLLMVIIGCIWPILLNTATGMRSIPPLRLETSRMMGLNRFQHVTKIVLPSLIPSAWLGVRVAASVAFVVTLFLEILGVTGRGIGALLVERQDRFDAPGTWGVLLIIGICGYLINALVAFAERWLLRGWPPSVTE